MPGNVIFVDCETSGLDPDRHEIWEIGLIDRDGKEHHWFLPIDESKADLIGLNIGGYFDRHPSGLGLSEAQAIDRRFEPVTSAGRIAPEIQRLTRSAYLAGAVVSFDEERLRRLMLSRGVIPAWHYHLIDVVTLAVGYLSAREPWDPPWSSTDLSVALGIDPEQFERHTALVAARWAKAMYEAVMGDADVS